MATQALHLTPIMIHYLPPCCVSSGALLSFLVYALPVSLLSISTPLCSVTFFSYTVCLSVFEWVSIFTQPQVGKQILALMCSHY